MRGVEDEEGDDVDDDDVVFLGVTRNARDKASKIIRYSVLNLKCRITRKNIFLHAYKKEACE